MAMDTTLQVQGMDCGGCAQRLRTTLGRLDGVLAADPDHRAGRVTVRFDPDRVTADGITRPVGEAGFAVMDVIGATGEVSGDGEQGG